MTGQFQHGDLVLATRTTNKLLDKVVGLVTGTIEDDVVSIRMLHVKRRWGNDGDCSRRGRGSRGEEKEKEQYNIANIEVCVANATFDSSITPSQGTTLIRLRT